MLGGKSQSRMHGRASILWRLLNFVKSHLDRVEPEPFDSLTFYPFQVNSLLWANSLSEFREV